MGDTVHTFSPPPVVLDDLSKNQNTENVVCQEPSHNDSSLNNTHTSVKIQRQCQCGLMYNMDPASPFIASQATMTGAQDKIKTHTIWSIVNIFCCCSCLGFIACYYSYKTSNLKRSGNIQGAMYASEQARAMNFIATVIGIIILIVFVFVNVVALQHLS